MRLKNSSGYGKFLHGEAIAIGQVAAARLSQKILGLPSGDVERIEKLFVKRFAGEDQTECRPAQKTFCRHAARPKKSVAAKSSLSSLKNSAKVLWSQRVPERLNFAVLDEL